MYNRCVSTAWELDTKLALGVMVQVTSDARLVMEMEEEAMAVIAVFAETVKKGLCRLKHQ